MVNEMGRRIGHAPTSTRWTKASVLTRIRNDAVHAADIAVNPHKTSRQNPAIKKRAQLAFNKMRNRTFSFPLPGQKGLQMLGDNPIKGIIFGIPGTISGLRITNEETFISCIKAIAG